MEEESRGVQQKRKEGKGKELGGMSKRRLEVYEHTQCAID